MDKEVLLKLFDVHHRQLEKRREKILFISRSSAAFFVVLAGAVTAAKEKITGYSVWIIILGIFLFGIGACIKLYYDGRAYSEIYGVITKLNLALGLFEKPNGDGGEPLYPMRWMKASAIKPLQSVSHHCILVIFTAVASSLFLAQFT